MVFDKERNIKLTFNNNKYYKDNYNNTNSGCGIAINAYENPAGIENPAGEYY